MKGTNDHALNYENRSHTSTILSEYGAVKLQQIETDRLSDSCQTSTLLAAEEW